jgi:hypothetical protein
MWRAARRLWNGCKIEIDGPSPIVTIFKSIGTNQREKNKRLDLRFGVFFESLVGNCSKVLRKGVQGDGSWLQIGWTR